MGSFWCGVSGRFKGVTNFSNWSSYDIFFCVSDLKCVHSPIKFVAFSYFSACHVFCFWGPSYLQGQCNSPESMSFQNSFYFL